ncbi:alpha/beta hydrolase [Parapedobacter lycopersici]|uniref:alpha/beta hydrolase n=1 Tax=Parapedobacter lycopersici TaxID=1864939 RepID=UPI00214DB870|nr:alpha/beta fold hydrolase [Parapedobacter lycopersici]
MYTHEKQVIQAGTAVAQAKSAIVLLHGRGSSAQGILSLQHHLQFTDAAIVAPQATNNTWYPHSFMAPVDQNQPALDSALARIDEVFAELATQGMPAEQVYLVGFSQGACLALEYAARHARRYRGIVAFTGGLIGATLDHTSYQGDFDETPVLITAGDHDAHVPLARIEESATILRQLGAQVTTEIYPGKPHSISADETLLANTLIFQ